MTDEPLARSITVVGHGRAETRPDEAEVVLGVDVVRPTAGEARAAAAATMEAVFAALRDGGIDPADLRTAELSLGAELEYRPDGPPRRTGFRLTNRTRVRVRPPDDVARVVDAGVAAGATTVDSVSFRVADEAAARRAALTAAMEDARAAAEAVAVAAGARLGRVRSVREPAGGATPMPRLALMEARQLETPVSPGMTGIDAVLEVSWEIDG